MFWDMEALTFFEGKWLEGNPPIIGAMSHAAWLGSVVFDGARAFDGVMPDLDKHCQRVIRSAEAFGMNPPMSAVEIEALAREGAAKFPPGTALYIRPTMFSDGGLKLLVPNPDSTCFALTLWATPMPEPTGFSACLSPYRRPTPESAPTDAKASCLYPIATRAVSDAGKRGFDNGVMCDANGAVAEFATSNIFLAKDGVCMTPAANGTYLAGITRSRVIGLMRDEGIEVHETYVQPKDLVEADEIFSTGNYSKVTPVTRYEDRALQPGPMFRKAREMYMDFAQKS